MHRQTGSTVAKLIITIAIALDLRGRLRAAQLITCSWKQTCTCGSAIVVGDGGNLSWVAVLNDGDDLRLNGGGDGGVGGGELGF